MGCGALSFLYERVREARRPLGRPEKESQTTTLSDLGICRDQSSRPASRSSRVLRLLRLAGEVMDARNVSYIEGDRPPFCSDSNRIELDNGMSRQRLRDVSGSSSPPIPLLVPLRAAH